MRVDAALLAEVARAHSAAAAPADRFARIAGTLAFYAAVDLRERRVRDAAAVATLFRGYESVLRRRSLRDAGLVSSTASGICGGVHATASALCLEMALGVAPPPLAIVARNLLLSCQFLGDNPMHLFVLGGPDWGAAAIRRSNPEVWARAEQAPARHAALHGHATIAELLEGLDRGGRWFAAALTMVRLAREAYSLLGGKYPHSESFIPGGVALAITGDALDRFERALRPFIDHAKRSIAIWDDAVEFLCAAEPRFVHVGEAPATMVDFGQWDHDEHYDASYAACDAWGERRWSTPGAIVDGALVTTRLGELHRGLEEFTERSYHRPGEPDAAIEHDPLGLAIGARHPWNRGAVAAPEAAPKAAPDPPYSWASAMTWRRRVFEVGAYARIYVSALAGKLSASCMASSGRSLVLELPAADLPALRAEWTPPPRWNALERIRARAYAVAFSLLVARENLERARALLRRGERRMATPFELPESGVRLGAGLCGAGRGLLAHWAVLDGGVVARYQVAVPSRINAAPRTPWGEPGPCEQAMLNTPIVECPTRSGEFAAIDLVRAIQSFDPCTASSAHVLVDGEPAWRTVPITTDA